MHTALLTLTAEALERLADAHGDDHLIDPPHGTLDDALHAASAEIVAALLHLRAALTLLQPTIRAARQPCACAACHTTATAAEDALRALRDPLPPPTPPTT